MGVIKKIRMRPPGYEDILHPETSADMVRVDREGIEAENLEDALDEVRIHVGYEEPSRGILWLDTN